MSQLRRTVFHYAAPFAPLLLVAVALGAALPARAQPSDDIDDVAEPVVQPLPNSAGTRLNEALARLAKNPSDIEALISAGQAALGLGDVAAAVGFYQRADALAPGTARIKAGLAGAYVRSEDPFTAIPLYDEAERVGPIEPALLRDRGLAYDLVGDNVTAQIYYKKALEAGSDDETLRRLALSQAIAGDRRGMELTLAPLLQKQDKAAWRARAFALAILGNSDEAESIARASMPADLANGLAGYLRYMPKLTAAQQAAAANLGHFPRAAEIGHDDPRLALLQRPRAVVARVEQTLTPSGQPLGSGRKHGKPAAPPPEAAPVPPPAQIVTASASPPVVASAPPAKPPVVAAVTPPPAPVKAAAPVATQPALIVTEKPFALPPTLPAANTSPAPTPVVTPVAAPAARPVEPASSPSRPPPPPPPAERAQSFSDVFADFTAPSREMVPASGAVDVRKLAGAEAKEAKKPPVPTSPSRIWVQVATGRNTDALAFDWRRMTRENADLFKARKGFTSAWGQTNRLLTGPFESELAANGFIAQLRKAKLDGAFVWTSPAGQVVDAIAAGK